PATGVHVTCKSAALDCRGRTLQVDPATGVQVTWRSAAELWSGRTFHVDPASGVAVIWLSALVELRTARIATSATDEGPLAKRTASAQAVEAGAAPSTAAFAMDESGSPMLMISWCITLELRLIVMVASLKVTVEGSAPLMLEKVATY